MEQLQLKGKLSEVHKHDRNLCSSGNKKKLNFQQGNLKTDQVH